MVRTNFIYFEEFLLFSLDIEENKNKHLQVVPYIQLGLLISHNQL